MPEPTVAASSYAGAPGGPRDPATPGGYCLARCYCGTCPQHKAQQQQIEELRRMEFVARVRRDDDRTTRRRTRKAA